MRRSWRRRPTSTGSLSCSAPRATASPSPPRRMPTAGSGSRWPAASTRSTSPRQLLSRSGCWASESGNTFHMATTTTNTPIEASGTFAIGGDLTVHRLGFGAMQLTGEGIWGEPKDHDECVRVLRRAVELGVDLIDTADSYGPFVSEDLIREALHPYPDDLVIATKGGLTRAGPGDWRPVARPAYLRQCVEMSLRRLGLER